MNKKYCSKCKEFKSDFANWDCFNCGRTEQARLDREEIIHYYDIQYPGAWYKMNGPKKIISLLKAVEPEGKDE